MRCPMYDSPYPSAGRGRDTKLRLLLREGWATRARGFWIHLAIVVFAISFAFVAHLIEIALWAVFFA